MDGSVKPTDLERTSITLEQFPRIEDEHVDELNVGSIYMHCK